MNNGFTTGLFALSRGVRQGDPLSPYLFMITLGTLAIKIREDDGIKGRYEMNLLNFPFSLMI